MYKLNQSQAQMICFVMIDINGTEVAGLGAGLTLEVSKAGGAFAPSAGVQAEIGSGWYRYTLTVAETNTIGPLSVRANGAGCIQQNLAYVVRTGVVGAVEFTYTVTNVVTGAPIEGAEVWITTDIAGANVIWKGETDTFGVVRDDEDNLPWLDPGDYYFWTQKVGFSFTNPDLENVA